MIALAIQTETFGPQAWQSAIVEVDIGDVLAATAQPAQALSHLRRAHTIFTAEFGTEDKRTLDVAAKIEEVVTAL